jgi:hypothetical protein
MPITIGVILEHNTLFTVTFYANNYWRNFGAQYIYLFTVTFYANNQWRNFGAQRIIYCDILCQ